MGVKIFITGHKGKLGQVIVNQLKNKYDFQGYDIKDDQKDNLSDVERLKKAIQGCEYVIHAAAIPHPRQGTFDDYFNTNIIGSLNVMKAASNKIKRFIFLSSIGYYGCSSSGGIQPLYFPIDEQHPTSTQASNYQGKLEIYDQTKVVGEHFLEFFASNAAFEGIALRIAPANSKKEQYPKNDKWKKNPGFRTRGFWSNCDPISVVNAIECCIESDKKFIFEPFNIGDLYTYKDVDLKHFVKTQYPNTTIKQGYDFSTSLYSSDKAQKEIGFIPLKDRE